MTVSGTVLVTGGAGYIGSHAVLALRDAGRDVVVLDDLSTGLDWAVPEGVPLVRGDIGDHDLTSRTFAEHGVSAIMHFAGSIIVPESVVDPLKYYRNNTAATRALIDSAVGAGVRHFIFSSTAATYGEPQRVPIREEDPTVPINPYGRSKLMTEWMLRDVSAAHPMNHGCLRYFNVAGADPRGRSGQSTAGATHLIKVACEAATGRRDGVVVAGTDYETPDGTGVRDYIHVSDLAAAHVVALEALEASPERSFTYNCGYGHGYSVLEVLDAVDAVVGAPIKRSMGPRRAGDPPSLVADSGALRRDLGWAPARDDLKAIIADALAWEAQLAERRRNTR